MTRKREAGAGSSLSHHEELGFHSMATEKLVEDSEHGSFLAVMGEWILGKNESQRLIQRSRKEKGTSCPFIRESFTPEGLCLLQVAL